jgi:methionyl aminopeptidase
MIVNKTKAEIESMRIGGEKLGRILDELILMSHPETKLNDIEKKAQELILKSGGKPSFMTVGNYRWATCLCINDEVVHGIPTERKLKSGDLLTIDIGLIYENLHTDTSYSFLIKDREHSVDPETDRFLSVGKTALNNAINITQTGNRIGHISKSIQNDIEQAGYNIVRTLVGHGVGRNLHEEPQIPGFVKNDIAQTPEMIPDMTLAIEIIYAKGSGQIVYANDDGWTLSTRDRSLSAVFEHTILVTKKGPEVLTRRPSEKVG